MKIKKKINFLNNKDLLFEINESKKSFCFFIFSAYSKYDVIISSLEKINGDLINNIFEKNEPKNHIIFRVYTNEHVPKTGDKKIKLNFHPFKHYMYHKNNTIVEVGRSHWKGDFKSGEFSTKHGSLTPRLVSMLILMVDKYSQKSNWRNYSWLDDMKSQALLQLMETALKFDERKSENPFAYYTCIISNSFKGMINFEEKNTNIKNVLMMENGYDPNFDLQTDNELKYKDIDY